MMSGHGLASVLMTFPVGILSDRIAPENVLTIGAIICGLFTLLFSMANSVTYLTCIYFIHGMGSILTASPVNKIIRLISDPTKVATNISTVMTAMNVAGI